MLLLFTVHIKHTDGHFEKIPYFSLPANDLTEVIAPSCYSCFDYPNALADLVVGYMGVPYEGGNFSSHPQVRFQIRSSLNGYPIIHVERIRATHPERRVRISGWVGNHPRM